MASTGGRKGTRISRLVRINSENRINPEGTTSSNFTVNFNNSLQLVQGISFVSAQWWNAMYNVLDAPNRQTNQMQVVVDDHSHAVQTYVITITPGWYTLSQLMTAIQAAFASFTFPVPLTLSYDPIQNRVSHTVTGGFSVTVSRVSGQFSWLGFLLGYPNTSTPQDWSDTSIAAIVGAPNMGGPKQIYITSSTISPGNSLDEKGRQSDVCLALTNDVPFGSLGTFECKVDQFCEIDYKRTRNLSNIDIQVVDHEGFEVDFHGLPINIELRVYMNVL